MGLLLEPDAFWTAIIGDFFVLLGAAATVVLSVRAARKQLSLQLKEEAKARATEQRAEWDHRRREHKEEQDAKRRSIATALMSELRWVEHALIRLHANSDEGLVGATVRAPVYDRFEADLGLFEPATIHALVQFRSSITDLEIMLADDATVAHEFRADYTRVLRVRAGFAAQRVPELRRRLEEAGGVVPPDIPLVSARRPEDVLLPPPAFPLDLPGA